MIFPTTTLAALLAVLLTLLCWSSWANTQRLSGRWRFEFYYYDFTWGVFLLALVAAFTLGSMSSQELTFQDNFLLTSYRRMAWALTAGAIFNLGNLLLVGAVVLAGMSVAFPVSLGLAAILMVLWNFIQDPRSPVVLPLSGSVLVVVGVALSVVAYLWSVEDTRLTAQRAFIADPRLKAPAKKAAPLKGVILAVLGGVFLAISRPMVNEAVAGDNGVSSYGTALLFGTGMVLSSLLFVPFFLNFPVEGRPEQIRMYFKGTKKQHFLGVFGGILWGTGLISSLVANDSAPAARVSPSARYLLVEGAAVLAACWGLFVWREFKGASQRVHLMLAAMLILLLAGFGVIGIARTS